MKRKRAQYFLNSLMTAKIETLDEQLGMSVLRDIPDLLSDDKNINIILRKQPQMIYDGLFHIQYTPHTYM